MICKLVESGRMKDNAEAGRLYQGDGAARDILSGYSLPPN
jgi:hypothetical protein